MKAWLSCVAWAWLAQAAMASDCAAPETLARVQAAEAAFQSGKFPPAYRHSVEAGHIRLMLSGKATEGGQCEIELRESLPAAEVEEARALIDAAPARRIMLLSQGYALPESAELTARFHVDAGTLAVAAADTLQLAELGRLRATVELLYATLSQARAEVSENSTNAEAWLPEFRAAQVSECVARGAQASACECRARGLERHMSARQMEYAAYVRENPYALATGAARGYEALESEIRRGCGG
jgi:thioredoxin-like negative regulator of GroEL